MQWNDKTGTLTIGRRTGDFEGMLRQRRFRVVLVSKENPVGFLFAPALYKGVSYSGDQVQLKLQ
ncbi:MAG: DUF5110 domain-containing protein [Terracidiphilus sp.]